MNETLVTNKSDWKNLNLLAQQKNNDMKITEDGKYLRIDLHDPSNYTQTYMATSYTYPHSFVWNYYATLTCIDLDKERENDVATGNGFIVDPYGRNIKKELKAENGIFSPKFGRTLADTDPYMDKYKCRCPYDEPKKLWGRINKGLKCPTCGHICEEVGDNFSYFGWIVIDEPYMIMSPAFYKKVESFLGAGIPVIGNTRRTKLENILDNSEYDIKATTKAMENKLKKEPFMGIGMTEFIKRFDEIMSFYLKLNSYTKKEAYQDIYANKDIGFTHSIPVFSTLLRPIDISDKKMTYEPTNGYYSLIHKFATSINRNATKIQRNLKVKNQHLWKLQYNLMQLYTELENILSGKKGDFRCLVGGRYNFSSRSVIVQNPELRIDEVTLPVVALTVMLEQRIKNILVRIYGITYNEAHSIWYDATIKPSENVSAIVQSIIDDYKREGIRGIPIIINRNPTIGYGSVLQMFCIGFTNTYTMAVPLQPLPLLAADFDGDVLNIMIPMNKVFIERVWAIFNPRNTMYISRNDGYFNKQVSMQRDTLINANTLARLGRDSYTEKEIKDIEKILKIKEKMLTT